MLHFLANVRQSMLACRRTQPLPQDFLQSLHLHHLSLRSLLPHLDPPVPPSRSQFSLSFDDAAPELQQQPPALNFAVDDKSKSGNRPYIPKSFPAFPSEHTYKATPDIPVRENDPRKMRERATEEGRLGEAALRKLVGARTDDTVMPGAQDRRGPKSMRAIRFEAWKEAMEAATPSAATNTSGRDSMHMDTDDDPNKQGGVRLRGYLGPAVNADRRYWRKHGTSRTPGIPVAQGPDIL